MGFAWAFVERGAYGDFLTHTPFAHHSEQHSLSSVHIDPLSRHFDGACALVEPVWLDEAHETPHARVTTAARGPRSDEMRRSVSMAIPRRKTWCIWHASGEVCFAASP